MRGDQPVCVAAAPTVSASTTRTLSDLCQGWLPGDCEVRPWDTSAALVRGQARYVERSADQPGSSRAGRYGGRSTPAVTGRGGLPARRRPAADRSGAPGTPSPCVALPDAEQNRLADLGWPLGG